MTGEPVLRREELATSNAVVREFASATSCGRGDPPTGSGFIDGVDLNLPCDPSAPGRARAEIRRATEAVLAEDALATAGLLTSEVVTNAVIHPQEPDDTSIRLRIRSFQRRIRVEVTDSGSGFDLTALGGQQPESGGRGLLIVDHLSERWGTTRRTGQGRRRFCVWFEVSQTPDTENRIAGEK